MPTGACLTVFGKVASLSLAAVVAPVHPCRIVPHVQKGYVEQPSASNLAGTAPVSRQPNRDACQLALFLHWPNTGRAMPPIDHALGCCHQHRVGPGSPVAGSRNTRHRSDSRLFGEPLRTIVCAQLNCLTGRASHVISESKKRTIVLSGSCEIDLGLMQSRPRPSLTVLTRSVASKSTSPKSLQRISPVRLVFYLWAQSSPSVA